MNVVGRTARRRRSLVMGVVAVALVASACRSSTPVVKLDGSPRIPDAEGVVIKASASGITLDANRRYTVSKSLVSFSTYNRRAVSLASTVGSYVHVGLSGREVRWLARIGVVTTAPDGHQTVTYQGDLVRVAGDRFDFKDGTVLRLAKGLTPPKDPLGLIYVVLDAQRHVIQGATFQSRAATTTTRTQNP